MDDPVLGEIEVTRIGLAHDEELDVFYYWIWYMPPAKITP